MLSSAGIPHRGLNTLWLITVCAITVTLLSGSFVTTAFGAPAKLDAIAPPPQSPFPLETQSALFTDAVAAALNNDNGDVEGDAGFNKSQLSAVDSYGNPIEALKPIETPDGRKVISAQGLQFEIPTYASGITEIKKPADDLLPPFIAPFATTTAPGSADAASTGDQEFGSSTKTTFTKSNEGKVLTNNIFGRNSGVTTPSKQFGFSTISTAGQTTVQKDFQHITTDRFSTSSNSFSGSSQTFNKAATPSGFSTFTSTQQSSNFGGFSSKGAAAPATNVGVGKYTGGFGGSPGVLGSGKLGYAVQADGSIRSPSNGALGHASVAAATTSPKLPLNANFANRIGIAAPAGVTSATGVGVNKYRGAFGGPPGVLVPFDNVKSG